MRVENQGGKKNLLARVCSNGSGRFWELEQVETMLSYAEADFKSYFFRLNAQ